MQNTDPKPKKGGVKIVGLKAKLEAKKRQPKARPTQDALLKKDTPIVKAREGTETALKNNAVGSLKETPSKGAKPRKEANKAPKRSDNELTADEVEGLRKPSTYLMFCDWVAQPEGFRNPTSQKEFAKLHNVSEDTLTDWKQRPTFWLTVEKRLKSQWREKSGQVIQSMYATILRKGSAKEVLLFFQLMWGLNLRDLAPDSAPEENNFDPAKLAQMAEAMKNAGLAGVTEHHKKLAETFNDLALTEDEDEEYEHTDD